MNLRKALLATTGVLSGAAIVHTALQSRAGDLEPPLPGDERSYHWRGMDVSYIDAGDPEDPDLVLLHGIDVAASSREWEPVFEALSHEYHVVAPDLPGFGRSDRPRIDYDAGLYVDFVRDFTDDVAPGAACVASSQSGAYAILAQREAGVFSRLVLVCPTAKTSSSLRALGGVLRTPVVGSALFDALSSKASIRYFDIAHGFHDPAAIDETDVDYKWRSAHQSGGRFAPAAFVSGRLDSDEDIDIALAMVDVPTTIVWGREADFPPLDDGRMLAETGDARLVVFDRAKLLPHVEHPDEFVEEVMESSPRAEA